MSITEPKVLQDKLLMHCLLKAFPATNNPRLKAHGLPMFSQWWAAVHSFVDGTFEGTCPVCSTLKMKCGEPIQHCINIYNDVTDAFKMHLQK
jgi:hypothetical protein